MTKSNLILGSEVKKPVKHIETSDRIREFRRACYLIKDVNKGQIITQDLLTTLRPNIGIGANDYFNLIGCEANSDLKKLQILDWKYFNK